LLARLRREAAKIKGEIVSIANSSDPYPNLEAQTGLMRKCIEILCQANCKIQIITKSDLVTRDIDLLKKMPSMVSLTITTDEDNIAKKIEPYAPMPPQRLKAAEILVSKEVPTSVRIDPVIPFVNDSFDTLIEKIASIGVKHIVGSTYKIKLDNWQRLSATLPEIAEKLKPLYFEKGERIGRYIYLPRDMRLELMKDMKTCAEKHGVKFGTCREGLSHLNTATCDGSWLLRSYT
jgi:DNA repair photolyase